MELQPIHPEPRTFYRKYLFSIDHKMIARQFLWGGLGFLFIGGLLAMVIRWQWAYPGKRIPIFGQVLLHETHGRVTPASYTHVFTMHGLIMVFFAITPLLIGVFGNYCIPLMIGARDMAFPRLNMYSFWTFVIAALVLCASFFMPLGTAGAGWTTYPPLATQIGTPGWGQTLVILAVFLGGVSTVMGAINYVTTVVRLRAPGMTYMRLPLTVWGLFLTSILNAIFVPVLGSAALLLLSDRMFGTHFFIAAATASIRGDGGDPILFQHLFWMFGHPEVYILVLPAWGIVSDFLAFFSRKPAFFYKGSVLALVSVTAVSGVVYGHHMYVAGMNPLLGKAFMTLTLLISLPVEVLFINWLVTMWRGSIRFTVPMLFAVGVVFMFGIGGLTGLLLGDISTDIYLHDTMFVVGHFHFTMGASTLLAAFAAIYYWFPKMFGRRMNEAAGKVHFWGTLVFLTLVFGGQMAAGWAGQQRRLFDPYQYQFLQHLLPLNRYTSLASFALFAFQIVFVANFLYSLRRGERAAANPWEVGTLEWSIPSPPPYHNFDVVPVVVRGPHDLSNPEVLRRMGRDWIGQSENLPGEPARTGETPGHPPLPAAA